MTSFLGWIVRPDRQAGAIPGLLAWRIAALGAARVATEIAEENRAEPVPSDYDVSMSRVFQQVLAAKASLQRERAEAEDLFLELTSLPRERRLLGRVFPAGARWLRRMPLHHDGIRMGDDRHEPDQASDQRPERIPVNPVH